MHNAPLSFMNFKNTLKRFREVSYNDNQLVYYDPKNETFWVVVRLANLRVCVVKHKRIESVPYGECVAGAYGTYQSWGTTFYREAKKPYEKADMLEHLKQGLARHHAWTHQNRKR